jgi:outer membrane protein insertion porin family
MDDYRDLAATEFDKLSDFSDPKTYRSSAGLSIQWISPMGPMIFSFAKALKKEDGDDTSFFSFNIGKTF